MEAQVAAAGVAIHSETGALCLAPGPIWSALISPWLFGKTTRKFALMLGKAEMTTSNPKKLRSKLAIPLLLILLPFPGGVARAAAYGSPVPSLESGQMAIGLAVSDTRDTLHFDYGSSDSAALRVLLGDVEMGGGTGQEYGVGYRFEFQERKQIKEYSLRLAMLAIYRMGSIDTNGGSADFNQIDLGFGGSTEPIERLPQSVTTRR